MRVALVHDWLTGLRGGERCLEVFCEIFPEADLFTLLHVPGSTSPLIETRRIVTSALDRLPLRERYYRYALPWMPRLMEAFDLSGYDLILSSSHCVAKGVIAPPNAVHVAYVHTPMRYAWDLEHEYLRHAGWPTRLAARYALHRLRAWDVVSAARVDHLIANSRFVAGRIQRYWHRDATVIHPPVDADFFGVERRPGDHYLIVSALVPGKGLDVAVQAFRRSGKPLHIVGVGPLERTLRSLAGPNVAFRGWISEDELKACYASARALVVPGIEDFGIAALEAMAAGCPVVAYGAGGSLESVVGLPHAGATGIFFTPLSVAALDGAIERFEASREAFSPVALRSHAAQFDRREFRRAIRRFLGSIQRGMQRQSDAGFSQRPSTMTLQQGAGRSAVTIG